MQGKTSKQRQEEDNQARKLRSKVDFSEKENYKKEEKRNDMGEKEGDQL